MDKRFKSKFPNLPFSEEFGLERITKITQQGKKEVFDLTVEDTHNFIAEGFVVHNTRWHFNDVYSYIINDLNPKHAPQDKYHVEVESCCDILPVLKYGASCFYELLLHTLHRR